MICVASTAVFLSLGILGPAGRFPTTPLTRFRVRWTTREESLPRRYGVWRRMPLRKAGAGAMRLLRRRRWAPMCRWMLPLLNLRFWRRVLPVDAHSFYSAPPKRLNVACVLAACWWHRLNVACVQIPLALLLQIASSVTAMSFNPSHRPQVNRCAPPVHKTSRMPRVTLRRAGRGTTFCLHPVIRTLRRPTPLLPRRLQAFPLPRRPCGMAKIPWPWSNGRMFL